MPAKAKAELLTITEQEFEKLHEVIDPIAEETALAKDNGDTSIKDVSPTGRIGSTCFWAGTPTVVQARSFTFPPKGTNGTSSSVTMTISDHGRQA